MRFCLINKSLTHCTNSFARMVKSCNKNRFFEMKQLIMKAQLEQQITKYRVRFCFEMEIENCLEH